MVITYTCVVMLMFGLGIVIDHCSAIGGCVRAVDLVRTRDRVIAYV